MTKFNYLVREGRDDKGFRVTIEAPSEAAAETAVRTMYLEYALFDLMAIIR